MYPFPCWLWDLCTNLAVFVVFPIVFYLMLIMLLLEEKKWKCLANNHSSRHLNKDWFQISAQVLDLLHILQQTKISQSITQQTKISQSNSASIDEGQRDGVESLKLTIEMATIVWIRRQPNWTRVLLVEVRLFMLGLTNDKLVVGIEICRSCFWGNWSVPFLILFIYPKNPNSIKLVIMQGVLKSTHTMSFTNNR